MKRQVLILLLLFSFVLLTAADNKQLTGITKDFIFKGGLPANNQPEVREQDPPPNYSFINNGAGDATTYLYDSYFDYMPYSYNGHNVRLQPEISMPYGYSAGGIYIAFHVSETPSTGTDRRIFNSYLNPDGTLFGTSATNNYDVVREGYPSLDIDPVTANPIFGWHFTDDDGTWDICITYDNFHLTGATGYWKEPWTLIDSPSTSEPLTGHSDDEYLWPIVMISDSPNEGYRRVHMYCNNWTANDQGTFGYNSLYCNADFNANDMLFESEFDWNIQTFPYMDYINYNGLGRVNKDMVVSGNKVAFFGNLRDSLFCLLSEDYGETFTWYKEEYKIPEENPLQQDGSYEFLDTDETTPSEMYWVTTGDGSHHNGEFIDNDTKVIWMSGINLNTQENMDQDLYMAAYFYPKIFTFDIETQEFHIYDMDIQGTDPADDIPCTPWDLDEDGEVDEYYDDGSVYIPLSMSTWFFNTDQGYQDGFFHESNFRISKNGNWIVAGWHDAKKLRMAYFEEEGYDGWFKQPEMCFSISDDFGETWSDPLIINANPNDNVVDEVNHYENHFAPELDGMLPVDITFGEELEVISNEPGNYHAKLHIAFFDDNDYGGAAGSTTGSGVLNGGKLRYMALDLEFQEPWMDPIDADDNTVTPSNVHLRQNYPNPFNPETRIQYSLEEATNLTLEIYNVKGQKIRTLIKEHQLPGEHETIWNGTDDNNIPVSSGVYFYKVSTDHTNKSRKMVLLK